MSVFRSIIFLFAVAQAGAVQQIPKSTTVVLRNDYVLVGRIPPATVPPRAIADCLTPKPLIRILIPAPESYRSDELPSPSVFFWQAGNLHGCSHLQDLIVYEVELETVPPKSHFQRDAVRLDPTHNHVLLENDLVRAVHVHFWPGESGPLVDKRPRVILLLTDMHAIVTFPDGHSEPREGKAGDVYFGNAGAQATKNTGTKPLDNIVVELKPKPH